MMSRYKKKLSLEKLWLGQVLVNKPKEAMGRL